MEWREVFSVNDTIVTDFGGLSIGEPWYQLSHYLLTRQNPAARVLGFIHPLNGLHAVFDPASLPRPPRARLSPGTGSTSRSAQPPPTHTTLPTPAPSRASGCGRGSPFPGVHRAGNGALAGVGGAFEHLQYQRRPPRRHGPGTRRLQRGRLLRQGRAQRGGGFPGERLHPRHRLRVHPLSQGAGDQTTTRGGSGSARETICTWRTPATSATSTRSFTSSGRSTRGTGAARPRRHLGVGSLSGLRAGQRLRAERLLGGSRHLRHEDDAAVLRLLLRVRGQPQGAPRGQRRPGHDRHRGVPELSRVDRGPRSLRRRVDRRRERHGHLVPVRRRGSGWPIPGTPVSVEATARWSTAAAASATRPRGGRSRATPSGSPAGCESAAGSGVRG